MISADVVLRGSSWAGGGGRGRLNVVDPEAAGRAGSSGCAQFDSTNTRFISARRSTKSIDRFRPEFQRKRPFASSETGAKNVTQGGMSRRLSPILAAALRKFSCVFREVAPYAARVEAGVEPPTKRSWAPQVSSTSERNTRPMSDKMTRPFEMAALHCTLTVSAQLIRSEVSSSR